MHRSQCAVVVLALSACGPGRLITFEAESGETVDPTSDDDGPLGESEVDDGEWDSDSGDPMDSEGEGESEDEGDAESGGDGAPNGAACTSDPECASQNCDVIPFLGGQCGECNEDADCTDGGCTHFDPFTFEGSTCNKGELGGGCEDDDACMPGLECAMVFELLGLIQLNTCSECLGDNHCPSGQICAPLFQLQDWAGTMTCIPSHSLPQHAYCDLEKDGDLACASGICSPADLQGLALKGACGECLTDADCGPSGTCYPAWLDLETGQLTGSLCGEPP